MKPLSNIFFCVRTFPGVKSNFMSKGIPIGFEMAEKKVYTHFRIYTSRDILKRYTLSILVPLARKKWILYY